MAGFQGKTVVLVEDEDGFQIPMLKSQVVVIGDEDYDTAHVVEARQATAQRTGASASKHVSDSNAPATHSSTVSNWRVQPQERKGGERLSAYLAFVPMDVHQLSTTRFEAYFVNDSNYYLRVAYLSADGSSYRLRQTMEVEPNTQVFLEEFGREDLAQLERICVQMLAYKRDKTFLPKPAISVQLRVDGVKFYKLHTFQPSEFFEQPALIYTIVEDDRQPRPLVIDAKELKDSMYGGQADAAGGHAQPHAAAQPDKGQPLVVDLHADQLLDTTAGMQPQDILDYQMDVFRRTLQNYARKRGTRIIFIHGKGDGVLRQAIVNDLRYRYKQYTYQDASFREYGYGATQVTIRS